MHLDRLLLCALLFAGCKPQQQDTVVVAAAASLKDVVDEAVLASGMNVTVSYGASTALRQQIVQFAPVDLFLSASADDVDELVKAGLGDGAPVVVAGNSLVFIVPADSKAESLDSVDTIAIGNPETVPAGRYATTALARSGTLKRAKVQHARDVRQVLAWVESGVVPGGVVYATDAKSSSKVRVLVELPLPEPVPYTALVIKGSKHSDEARRFLAFLTSENGRAIFRKHGFVDGKAR